MLGEESISNPVPFHQSARTQSFVSSAVATVIAGGIILFFVFLGSLVFNMMFVFFSLLFLFMFILVFQWWYIGEFFNKFKFELRDRYFFSRTGVFKESYTAIPYERIQDIHVTQSFFEKTFGLWSVSIYTATATGRGAESVFGLSQEDAQKLKSSLFIRIKKVRKVVD